MELQFCQCLLEFDECASKYNLARARAPYMQSAYGAYKIRNSDKTYVFAVVVLRIHIVHYNILTWYEANVASYPGSDYAGEEKRAWYILLAHALNFQRILWICILSVYAREQNLARACASSMYQALFSSPA